jgi:hypothetical protein
MINHARTLLLNPAKDSKPAPDLPGEHIVPESYRQIVMPSSVERFRRCVFGTAADRLMYNYRLWQLMTILHATELEEYVTGLDPRITYWPLRNVRGFLDAFAPVVPEAVHLLGDLSPATDGQLQHRFLLTYQGGASLRVQRLTSPANDTVYTVVADDAVTSPVPLAGTSLQAEMRVPLTQVGKAYEVVVRKRPAMDLPACLAALTGIITEEDMQDYKDFGGPEITTFLNLYRQHPQLPYKLGGLVLAVIYRAERARSKGAT